MTKSELNDTYFNWMCQLVFDGRYSKKLSYRRLLKVLHKIEFTYSIPTVSYTHLDVYKRQARGRRFDKNNMDVLCSGSTYGDTFHCMFNRR